MCSTFWDSQRLNLLDIACQAQSAYSHVWVGHQKTEPLQVFPTELSVGYNLCPLLNLEGCVLRCLCAFACHMEKQLKHPHNAYGMVCIECLPISRIINKGVCRTLLKNTVLVYMHTALTIQLQNQSGELMIEWRNHFQALYVIMFCWTGFAAVGWGRLLKGGNNAKVNETNKYSSCCSGRLPIHSGTWPLPDCQIKMWHSLYAQSDLLC